MGKMPLGTRIGTFFDINVIGAIFDVLPNDQKFVLLEKIKLNVLKALIN